MKVFLNDQIPLTSWEAIINTHPFASPFQTHAFYKLFNSVPGLSAIAIAIEDSELIKALAVITLQKENGLKGYFSRRGIIYGGILIDLENPAAFSFLLDQISLIVGRNVIYIETRNLTNYGNSKAIFISHGWKYISYLNFHLNTSEKENMIRAISNSRLRQIKKSVKSGTFWKEAETIEEVKAFYNILFSLYKTKIKKPLLPWDFFKKYFEQKFGKYLLICFNDKVIGGIMCPIFRDKAIYEFYICGLDFEFKEQQPSVMATWAAMEYANQRGIPVFDFMGAGKPEEAYGVRDFKARFGGKEVEYGRFLKVNKPVLYALGKSLIKIRQRIK
jgi:serine/alanine adding enzyme